MPLDDYRKKRDFSRSPEPAGTTQGAPRGEPPQQPSFVVQKHQARRLHYDLRLECDGVLKSWALPKGPSLDPKQKRLAVEVEDHPLEYGAFEGVIPDGEYGAGTVIVWDRGTWSPEEQPQEALEQGLVKFQLLGQKLRGRWMLLRLPLKEGEAKPNWLLVKERDEYARPSHEIDILASQPESALEREDLLGDCRRSTRRVDRVAGTVPANDPEGHVRDSIESPARCAVMPTRISPQLASPIAQPPEGDQWLHEIKLDGYRLLCFIHNNAVDLLSRRNVTWTARFPRIAAAARRLPVKSAILDGELVALRDGGVSDFQLLQSAIRQNSSPLIYFVFDFLYFDGFDLRSRVP